MVEQTIEQCDDARRVGEDFIPFFEWTIRSQDHRLAFVTPVDDLVEQVRGLVIEGQIPDLINAQ